jgi:tetratricopeptide (TPR) repeat protein
MTAFREAIQLTDNLPAAHNGLAWALLHAEPVTPNAIEQAIGEAKLAVEQTAELDYSAMDTLALAYYRSGDKESAVKTIERALKLRPNDPELKARLKSFK